MFLSLKLTEIFTGSQRNDPHIYVDRNKDEREELLCALSVGFFRCREGDKCSAQQNLRVKRCCRNDVPHLRVLQRLRNVIHVPVGQTAAQYFQQIMRIRDFFI